MLTAVLPLHIHTSAFWSSHRGKACLHAFLDMVAGMKVLDQLLVAGPDEALTSLGRQYGVQPVTMDLPGRPDRPFTFEEFQTLARCVLTAGASAAVAPQADLMLLDHRNLSLTPKDLTTALTLYRQHPDAVVVSLTPCRDHPCQYQAYYTFLGCELMRWNRPNGGDVTAHRPRITRRVSLPPEQSGCVEPTLHVKDTRGLLHFDIRNQASAGLVAHILPVSAQGPQYQNHREVYITSPDLDVAVPTADGVPVDGVLVTLFSPEISRGYDTVESFTPRNGSWQASGPAGTLIDKKSYTPILGRQQFAPVYSYDGSCCLLNGRVLNDMKPDNMRTANIKPFILNRACFVTDELDYLLCTA